MTPQEINIAIAEACGWKIEPTAAKGGWKLYCGSVATSFWWNPERTPTLLDVADNLPDYCDDLNAMHEAWCSLSRDDHLLFRSELAEIVRRDGHICGPCRSACNATAAQRAEVFLRTIGKWQERALDQCQPKA